MRIDTAAPAIGLFVIALRTTPMNRPWFAEADNAKAEDDGYVVVFQWNNALQRQTLDIFDARDIAQGPVAQVELPQRLPAGFHACWIERDRLRAPA